MGHHRGSEDVSQRQLSCTTTQHPSYKQTGAVNFFFLFFFLCSVRFQQKEEIIPPTLALTWTQPPLDHCLERAISLKDDNLVDDRSKTVRRGRRGERKKRKVD
eukprot:TRINITY_DN13605_c0_g1_i1.p2 TRINITY_DN13605_c0_g1~~TRINITY_DN13605_c0_g1_i1.p2  ORF type:complete len:103 (-),score=4.67 TRINITY_DN13605_c0_g1_i1:262-570(-)